MSYAAAAHHAPATTDPTPDHSLLVSQDDSTPNPDAKHVKVASTQQDQDQSTTIPQKRGNETSSSTSAVPGLNGANPGGATSSGGKKKKNKKNKKDTATTTTTPPNTEEASPQETEKKSSTSVKEESSKVEDKKEQAKVEKKEQVQTEENKEPVKEKKNEEVEKKETKKVDSESKTSHDEDNGEDEKKDEKEEKEEPAGKGFDTELESMSSTQERPTVSKDLDQKLADPCTLPPRLFVLRRANSQYWYTCRRSSCQHRCHCRTPEWNYRERLRQSSQGRICTPTTRRFLRS